ncbi:MAG: pyridoxal-phosphate dependent enzyme [Eubacteriales bacterium]
MVRDFQMVVGIEAKEQFLDMTGLLPDVVCACVGGGSNAAGLFTTFYEEPVEIVGVEPMGRGTSIGDNAASITFGKRAYSTGSRACCCRTTRANRYPFTASRAVWIIRLLVLEHAFMHDVGRVQYTSVTDEEAMEAFFYLSRYEGIIPAIESSHALAYAMRLARENYRGSILVNLSGRGDKDIDYVFDHYGCGEKFFEQK